MAFKYAIALTGSIATGKSTVSKFFRDDGFSIVDADSIAHQILNDEHQTIAQLFGEELVKDKRVDRKALGDIVFNDIDKRKVLEGLLHPLIYTEIEMQATKLDKKEKPYLIDIPLFFETNRYPIEKSLVVYTPLHMQLQRLQNRDNVNKEEAQLRIDSQISIEEKRNKASYVIDNSGTLAQLEREYKRVQEEIVKDFI